MDAGYDLDPHSASANAAQAEYVARSAAVAEAEGAQLDLAYGAHPRQRLDVFGAGAGAAAILFFHGGYWRAGSKDSRRFPAPAWAARGVAWIPVNYRLVPEATLEDAVADARAALAFVAEQAGALGVDPARLHLSGNSAGAHLAAMAAAGGWPGRPPVASLSVVSGLFDLEPLLRAGANDWLGLDAGRARALSPVHHLPPRDLPVLVGCGGAETQAFKAQGAEFAAACRARGNPVAGFEAPGHDHFQVIGDYGAPGSGLFDGLARMVGA